MARQEIEMKKASWKFREAFFYALMVFARHAVTRAAG